LPKATFKANITHVVFESGFFIDLQK